MDALTLIVAVLLYFVSLLPSAVAAAAFIVLLVRMHIVETQGAALLARTRTTAAVVRVFALALMLVAASFSVGIFYYDWVFLVLLPGIPQYFKVLLVLSTLFCIIPFIMRLVRSHGG